MFLMFHLTPPDVLPVGDLGIRRAVTLERIADPWRPHRTLACRFLWRWLAATPAV